MPAPVSAAQAQPIFIVYGHDTHARNDLELLLRRMGLDPIILGRLPAAADTIIEKLERYLGEHGDIGFACVGWSWLVSAGGGWQSCQAIHRVAERHRRSNLDWLPGAFG